MWWKAWAGKWWGRNPCRAVLHFCLSVFDSMCERPITSTAALVWAAFWLNSVVLVTFSFAVKNALRGAKVLAHSFNGFLPSAASITVGLVLKRIIMAGILQSDQLILRKAKSRQTGSWARACPATYFFQPSSHWPDNVYRIWIHNDSITD